MDEALQEFFATIIEQCLRKHDLNPPLVFRAAGDNGSLLVVGVNEGAKAVVLTKHCETNTFTPPIKITVMGQNNKAARLETA